MPINTGNLFTPPKIDTPGSAANTAGKIAGYSGAALTALNTVAPSILAGTALASAPLTFGISAIPLAIQLFKKIGAGRRTADEFVKDYQDAFLKEVMAPISEQAKTDPEGAQQAFAREWSAYLQSSNEFAAENPTHAKVVDQMLHTPEFMNTAQALLPPGIPALDPSYTNGANFQNQGTNQDPSLLSSAVPLIASGAIYGAGKAFGGGDAANPNPTQDVSAMPGSSVQMDSSTPGGTVINPFPGTPAPGTSSGAGNSVLATLGKIFGVGGSGGSSGANGTPGIDQSTFQKLLPLLIGGGSVASDIFGAVSGSNAQNDAAKIQADATTKAAQLASDTAKANIAEQARQFDTTQANQKPWLSAGSDAIGRLTQMMNDGTFSPYGKSFEGNPDGTLFTGNPNTGSLVNNSPDVNAQFNGDPNTARQFTSNPDVLNAPQFDEKFSFTADDMLKDPGYQRRLADAQQAAERAASSKGNLFSPATAAAIASKVGAQASDEFGAANTRAQQEYLNRYNIFTGNAASKNAAAQGNFGNELTQSQANNQANQTNFGNSLTSTQQNNQSRQQNLSNALGINQQNNQTGQTNYTNASNQSTQNNATLNQNFQNELTKYLNGYNIYNTDQSNLFNRNAAISGIGQTAAGNVQSAGTNMVNANGATNTNSTNSINELMTNLAQAQAQAKLNANANKVGGVNNVSDDLTSLLHAYLTKAA